ncbi:MAG: cytochrome c oxidase cbb3-type subunit [Thermoanaerobaculia bacterium]|jgi:cytochrome c1|nr:cytochrome c oxidase cbb3-type subunit [Thermoanaerobaculia bacterium]
MKRGIVLVLALVLSVGAAPKKHAYDQTLPVLGTKFHSLPAGTGRQLVEASCLPCHSPDILVQQRLTEKQWTATVDKMIRWGAVLKETDKPATIAYLSKNFGVTNNFTPTKTRPVGY